MTKVEAELGSNLLAGLVRGQGHGWQSSAVPSVASP